MIKNSSRTSQHWTEEAVSGASTVCLLQYIVGMEVVPDHKLLLVYNLIKKIPVSKIQFLKRAAATHALRAVFTLLSKYRW